MEPFCRICYSETNPITDKSDLISPCNCTGSVKYVHHSCLKMWRIKGKKFRNIKMCEQCHGIYNIPGEAPVYSILISLITVMVMIVVFLLSMVVFKNLFEAISIILNEIDINNSINGINDNRVNSINNNSIINNINNSIIIDNINTVYIHLCTSIIIYNLFTIPKPVILTVYLGIFILFTIIKKRGIEMIFLGMTIYFIRKIYKEVYENVDGLYYYMKNIDFDIKNK